MCGRCACSLDKDTLSRACNYENATGKRCATPWVESDIEIVDFVPSVNIGPKEVVPCIAPGSFFGEKNDDQVLCPMVWGMIPHWHKGDYKKNSLSTHNARLDKIADSRLYASKLATNQRCIVVCEGYYEWKNLTPTFKQPYYIYPVQKDGIRVDDPTTYKNEWSMKSGWKGLKLMKMAGIFDSFIQIGADEKVVYSCSIITTEANSVLSWLHHRTPIFFNKEEDERAWLNGKLSVREAVDKLKALTLSEGYLKWHKVSTKVNKIKYKDEGCRKETKERGIDSLLNVKKLGVMEMQKEGEEQKEREKQKDIEKRKREDMEIESDCGEKETESEFTVEALMQRVKQENKKKKY